MRDTVRFALVNGVHVAESFGIMASGPTAWQAFCALRIAVALVNPGKRLSIDGIALVLR